MTNLATFTKMLVFFDKNRWKTLMKWTSCYSGSWKKDKTPPTSYFGFIQIRNQFKALVFFCVPWRYHGSKAVALKQLPPCRWLFVIIILFIFIINLNTILFTGSNQPPRFLNYFFSTYLLIYEDMPVGESPWHSSNVTDHFVDRTWWQTLAMNSELFLFLLSFRAFSYRRDPKWPFILVSHSATIHMHIHRMINLVIICQSAVLGEGSSVQLLPVLPVFFWLLWLTRQFGHVWLFIIFQGVSDLELKSLIVDWFFYNFLPLFFLITWPLLSTSLFWPGCHSSYSELLNVIFPMYRILELCVHSMQVHEYQNHHGHSTCNDCSILLL